MLELYHHGSSVCAAKVRFALAEKGLARSIISPVRIAILSPVNVSMLTGALSIIDGLRPKHSTPSRGVGAEVKQVS